MNAYLTYAAMVGAGLCGIEQKLEPPDEYKGNGYVATGVPRMPRALYEAIRELESVDGGGRDLRRGRRRPLPERGPRRAGARTTRSSTTGTASATSSGAEGPTPLVAGPTAGTASPDGMLARRAPAVTARLREQRGLETEAADRHPARRRRHRRPPRARRGAGGARGRARPRGARPGRAVPDRRGRERGERPRRRSIARSTRPSATLMSRRELLHRALRRPAQGDQLPVLRGLGRPRHPGSEPVGAVRRRQRAGHRPRTSSEPGRPAIINPERHRELVAQGEIEQVGVVGEGRLAGGTPQGGRPDRSASSSARPTRTCTTRRPTAICSRSSASTSDPH